MGHGTSVRGCKASSASCYRLRGWAVYSLTQFPHV